MNIVTKDKAIEEIFQAQTPQFDDGADFMQRLEKRLDAVEYLHQYQERTIRRYRFMMAATFVAGIVGGLLGTIWLLPSLTEASFAFLTLPTPLMLWFLGGIRLVAAAALPLLLMLAVYAIAINIMDINDMRSDMKKMTHVYGL